MGSLREKNHRLYRRPQLTNSVRENSHEQFFWPQLSQSPITTTLPTYLPTYLPTRQHQPHQKAQILPSYPYLPHACHVNGLLGFERYGIVENEEAAFVKSGGIGRTNVEDFRG